MTLSRLSSKLLGFLLQQTERSVEVQQVLDFDKPFIGPLDVTESQVGTINSRRVWTARGANARVNSGRRISAAWS